MGNLEPVRYESAILPYVGRFAPSPTGSVHMGIARTALLAWLDAKAHNGQLHLRIEDVDLPRVVEGSADAIQTDLRWLGLPWDGPVTYQSQRFPRYQRALEVLSGLGRVYECTCSRKEIRAASAPHGPSDEGPRYPGTCRAGAQPKPNRVPALRFNTHNLPIIRHRDRAVGIIQQNVEQEVGDFVLQRADRLWAYQLAVTVDDLEQKISCVVRGEDLVSSTPRQLLLRNQLRPEAPPLETMHVPLMVDDEGRRLAKRHGDTSIASLREAGVTSETIIGQLAHSIGLIPSVEPVTPAELISVWTAQLSERRLV